MFDAVRRVLDRLENHVRRRSSECVDQRESDTSTQNGEGAEPTEDPAAISPLEEQILAIVEDNGGRIEQAEIVSSVDYSASTVSRRLSEMEDDRIIRYKLGHRNVVCLADEASVFDGSNQRLRDAG